MEYPLCDQRVSIYRKTPDGIQRQVVDGCFYNWQLSRKLAAGLDRRERSFLLVIPGGKAQIAVGDRVLEGTGPEAKDVDWCRFVPGAVAGLSQVAYVKPWYYEGKLCHMEAGG